VGEEAGADVSDPTERVTDGVDRAADAAEEGIDRTAETASEQVRRARETAERQVRETSEKAKAQVRRTEEQVKEKVRRTEEQVRHQVEEVQRTVGEIKGLSEPTPADSADEAKEQAADLRRAIDRDLDTLQAKLPPGEELQERAKTIGGAVLGVVAVAAAVFVRQKQRKERKRIDREAKAHAAAISRYLPEAADRPRPEEKDGGKGAWVLLAVLAGAVAAAVATQRRGGDEPDIWGPPN
jgi:ElaB/YqjD/DUF883 family membrane-anchored ribosome-binding protein